MTKYQKNIKKFFKKISKKNFKKKFEKKNFEKKLTKYTYIFFFKKKMKKI